MPLGREHQRIRRWVGTDLPPGFDVRADALRNGDTSAAVFCHYVSLIEGPFIGRIVDDEMIEGI